MCNWRKKFQKAKVFLFYISNSKIILGSIARERIMKNQLQIEEEQYLENLYDAARDNTTQLTYDLYVQNIQLICPQIINSNYVHTTKVIY